MTSVPPRGVAFPAPLPGYNSMNESQFRSMLTRELRGLRAEVDALTNDGVTMDAVSTLQYRLGGEADVVVPGSNLSEWRAPYQLNLLYTRASLKLPSTGGAVTVDILVDGVSIFGTDKLTIDEGETSSYGSMAPPDFSEMVIPDNAVIDFAVIDGGTDAAGLKVYLVHHPVFGPPAFSGVLAAMTVGTLYTDTIALTGGASPYTLGASALPAGLSASLAGPGYSPLTITGTPTGAGLGAGYSKSFDVAINATDQDGAVATFNQTVGITVPTLVVTGTAPTGEIGVSYSYAFGTSGGVVGSKTFAVTAGALPGGLSLSTGGVMSGTPTTDSGSPFAFTVTATDTEGNVSAGSSQSVAVTAASDPFFANVVSLLHFDSVVTADQIPARTWTVTDSGTVSPTEKKFGAGGAYPITGMKADDSSDWAFGTGDYTVELWLNFLADPTGTDQAFISNYDAAGGGGGYAGLAILYSANSIYYYSGAGAGHIGLFAWPGAAAATWYHLAICRAAGSLRCFVNGVQVGSTVSDSTNVVVTRGPWLGRFSTAFGYNFFGAIDDVRVTKGVARYTANFTPPTGPFPNS